MEIRNILPGLIGRMEKAQSEIRAVHAEAERAGISGEFLTAMVELKKLPVSDPSWTTRALHVLGLIGGQPAEKAAAPDCGAIRLAHIRYVTLEELRSRRAGLHMVGAVLNAKGLAVPADDLLDVLDDLCARDLVRVSADASEKVYGITRRGSEVVDGLLTFDDIAHGRL